MSLLKLKQYCKFEGVNPKTLTWSVHHPPNDNKKNLHMMHDYALK